MSLETWVRLLRERSQLRTGSFQLSSTGYNDNDEPDFGSTDWDTEDPVDSGGDEELESDQEIDPLPLVTTLEDLSLRISSSDSTLWQHIASCRFANLKALQVDIAHSRTHGIGEDTNSSTVARLGMLLQGTPYLTSPRLYLPQFSTSLSIPFKFDPDEGNLKEILDAMTLMVYSRTASTLSPSEHLRRFTTAHRAKPNLNAQITDALQP
ncbi:hypothetical protein NLJ89_g4491 [Agrocybe chaxingu]|uniref:Uncharacterized protein n=1 Tax=Agrocybe chaxingu TaxID=84603 RepID=A0A9W8MXZ3_9AGAR|nr:hypothetical protein NLJ89_g4491 [Agrocybe chaxingu]